MIYIYFDGLTEPVNPRGISTYGYVIYKNNLTVIKEGYGLAAEPWSPNATNNVSEYTGLMCALISAIDLGVKSATVRGDSKLVISQMNGAYKVKSTRLIPIYKKVYELSLKLGSIKFEWVPRELNKRADKLSRIAYKEFQEGRLKYSVNPCS
ncbi:MAG: ribonuclease HI family protein [Nitrososphaerota archaeon]|nr:ribonuclease HI family protein [Nitrososphaerota archaeon]MDG6929885.1 ribonuclease HI family protein [Nitrososphaerota archaeon]MDG6932347.1 ribonuclease HI family protein [Nitrososphaerota archaeon]MDG6935906.1 ribonuclease HI family protein [Nitrososphaerota archaeon]MDG6943752.1 ribonuclease HI family protein [Nitrososphaerota archaeon]